MIITITAAAATAVDMAMAAITITVAVMVVHMVAADMVSSDIAHVHHHPAGPSQTYEYFNLSVHG